MTPALRRPCGTVRWRAACVTSDTRLRFSVIVPLGAQRGQTEACLRGWTRDQTFPRDRYEVLVVGYPPSLQPREVEVIRGLLSPPDRLLEHDQPHDLALSVR